MRAAVWVRGRVGAAGRSGGLGAGPSWLGALACRGSGAGAVSASPQGVIYMLSRPPAGSRACSSLTRSLALGSYHLSAATAQRSLREGERASEQGREGAKEEGTRTRPGSPSALLPALPSATGPPRAPLTLGKLRTALGPRVAPRGAARASSGGGGGGGRGGRKGSEPQGSAPSCLSSCFCSHPEQHSHKGANPWVVGWRR